MAGNFVSDKLYIQRSEEICACFARNVDCFDDRFDRGRNPFPKRSQRDGKRAQTFREENVRDRPRISALIATLSRESRRFLRRYFAAERADTLRDPRLGRSRGFDRANLVRAV